MEVVAKIIKVKEQNLFVKSAVKVVDCTGAEQDLTHVEYTDNPLEAKQFSPTNNDAEMSVQSASDSGFLTIPYSDPLQGGVERFEVVPLSIEIGQPVDDWTKQF